MYEVTFVVMIGILVVKSETNTSILCINRCDGDEKKNGEIDFPEHGIGVSCKTIENRKSYIRTEYLMHAGNFQQ
jgi:hypothetical protein